MLTKLKSSKANNIFFKKTMRQWEITTYLWMDHSSSKFYSLKMIELLLNNECFHLNFLGFKAHRYLRIKFLSYFYKKIL